MTASANPALVTGASGFVGSAVVRALLAEGRRVRVLLRPTSDRRNIAGLEVEERIGSLGDWPSLKAAVAGCGAVFHVAADYRLWVRDPEAMYAANVDGTTRLMTAALEAGVERIVYTSSVATLGLAAGGTPADEMEPSLLADMIGPYKRSKYLAEERVRQMVGERGLPAVVVNPSTPIGPRDVKPTPTGRLIVEAASGRMPAFVDTGLNLVHVDDVAAGHLLAERAGRIGERYILGGENLTLARILQEIAQLVRPQGADLAAAGRGDLARRARRRGDRTRHRARALRHARRAAHGAEEDVLHLRQGRARARLSRAPRRRGARRRGRLVPRGGHVPMSGVALVIAGAAFAAWIYLLLGRGFFWLPRFLPRAARAAALAERRRHRPGAERGAACRRGDRLALGAGLSRRLLGRAGGRPQQRRHGRGRARRGGAARQGRAVHGRRGARPAAQAGRASSGRSPRGWASSRPARRRPTSCSSPTPISCIIPAT